MVHGTRYQIVKESGNRIYTAALQITTNPIIAGHKEKRLPNVHSTKYTSVCYIINFIPCWFYCCLVPTRELLAARYKSMCCSTYILVCIGHTYFHHTVPVHYWMTLLPGARGNISLLLPLSSNNCIDNSNLSGAILTPTIFSGSIALWCSLL